MTNKAKQLEEYYKKLYEDDNSFIIEKSKKYSDDENIRKAYLDGYKESIKYPHTRSIRLIVLYVSDYIPWWKKFDHDNIISHIRDIFKNKLYPKGLFDDN